MVRARARPPTAWNPASSTDKASQGSAPTWMPVQLRSGMSMARPCTNPSQAPPRPLVPVHGEREQRETDRGATRSSSAERQGRTARHPGGEQEGEPRRQSPRGGHASDDRAGGTTHRKVTADPCVLRAVTNNVSLAMFSTERTGHAVSASPESGSSPFRDHELRNSSRAGQSQDRADLRRWFIGAGQRGVKPAVRSGNSRRVEQLGRARRTRWVRRIGGPRAVRFFRLPRAFRCSAWDWGVTADCAPSPRSSKVPA